MFIPLDHGAPRGLVAALSSHRVVTAQEKGWDRLDNGALLDAAEEAAIDVLVTTDSGTRYQQNLSGRRIALIVLTGTTRWSRVRLHLSRIAGVVSSVTPGSYTEINIPFG